jgi:hypothetical protein
MLLSVLKSWDARAQAARKMSDFEGREGCERKRSQVSSKTLASSAER